MVWKVNRARSDWSPSLNESEISPNTSELDAFERALDHLFLIRVHLDSIERIANSKVREQLVGPWLVLAARQAQLDVRLVVEELMLLSIAAHQEAGAKISRKLRKAYQVGVVAKELTQLNPNYFPRPISVEQSDEPQFVGRFVAREANHLTSSLAVKYWNKAGSILHANSGVIDEGKMLSGITEAQEFLNLTSALLETFEVDISGNGMWFGGHLYFGAARDPELFLGHFVR